MQTLFIGIFILAILAGVVAQLLGSSQKSFIGYFMSAVGYKDRQETQNHNMKQIFAQFKEDKEQLADYVKEQIRSLNTSRDKMGSLTEMVTRMNEKSGVDLLHLKGLLKDFENQNVLLVQNGDKLIKMRDKQKSMNEKMVKQLEVSSRIFNSDFKRVVDNFKSNLSRQEDLVSSQIEENNALRDKMKEIQDRLKEVNEHTPAEQIDNIKEKLKKMSEDTRGKMDYLKEKQEQLRNMNQNDINNIDSIKQKIEDLSSLHTSSDLMARNDEKIKDLNERLKDQLERAKEKTKR